jgi:hypothetical protein
VIDFSNKRYQIPGIHFVAYTRRELGVAGQFALRGCIVQISADRERDNTRQATGAQSDYEPSASAMLKVRMVPKM